ncbi:hypothetical protein HOG21_03500 [bacterium]|nr:hypothetical protein [bacterium]
MLSISVLVYVFVSIPVTFVTNSFHLAAVSVSQSVACKPFHANTNHDVIHTDNNIETNNFVYLNFFIKLLL